MIQVNSLSVLIGPPLPWASSLQVAAFTEQLSICEMSDLWPDMMTKFIISPVKSSTDNRLLRGMIREGCLAVAWDTVISLSYPQDH